MKYIKFQQDYLNALKDYNRVYSLVQKDMKAHENLNLSDDEDDWTLYDRYLFATEKKYKYHGVKLNLREAENSLIDWGFSFIDKMLSHPDIKQSYEYSLIRSLKSLSTTANTKILKYRKRFIDLFMKLDYYKITRELSLDELQDNDVIYYYVAGNSGMTSNGKFTKDMSRWITFTKEEKERIESKNIKPYGATKLGAFISVSKF